MTLVVDEHRLMISAKSGRNNLIDTYFATSGTTCHKSLACFNWWQVVPDVVTLYLRNFISNSGYADFFTAHFKAHNRLKSQSSQ
jgi:hypothetical protein